MRTTSNPVALAVWKDKIDLFDRIGSGKDYTERDAASGSLHLSFRSVEPGDFTQMVSHYGDNAVSDVCLYIWFDNNTSFSMEFNASNIGFANQRRIEDIAALMKRWNTRAEKLYDKRRLLTDTRESFSDCLRRMITATGAVTTLCIGDWYGGPERKYENIDISTAIGKYVMPAVGQVRAKLRNPDPAQQAA